MASLGNIFDFIHDWETGFTPTLISIQKVYVTKYQVISDADSGTFFLSVIKRVPDRHPIPLRLHPVNTLCFDLSAEDGCRFNAVSSVPVSITTASIIAHSNSKNRMIKSRLCNVASLKLTTTDQTYVDPVLGASASFIQRLLEMSALQEKTVHQEKIKELKKTRRHEPHSYKELTK